MGSEKNRGMRKANVVKFVSNVEKARKKNRKNLIDIAKKLLPTALPGAQWEEPIWEVTGGRLLVLKGKNVQSVTLRFFEPPKVSNDRLDNEFADVTKALVTLRFNRRQQNVHNQRHFITAFAYVAVASQARGRSLERLTPADFNSALRQIVEHYAESTSYNLAKCLNEIAAHLDENGLCQARLDYTARMKRPETANTIENRSFADPEIDEPERADQLVDESVYQLIGKLFRSVPGDSPDRMYVLILTLLACTGRRFSEIVRMPDQAVEDKGNGTATIRYFRRKASQGETFTPESKLWLPSATVEIVREAIDEARTICQPAREVAANMRRAGGPDLTFLSAEPGGKRYYKKDLVALGLGSELLDKGNGWIRKNGLAWQAPEKRRSGSNPPWYTNLDGIKAYCEHYFQPWMVQHVEVDQYGNKVYPENVLFLKFHNLAFSTKAGWLAHPVSHAMVEKWIKRRLPPVANEYAPEISAQMDLTSHAFRHTMNHMLDQGGLSELIQTSWFGRSNPRDTKAYQHTSREKRVSMVMKALRDGDAAGKLADDLEIIPVDKQEAYLEAKIGAVHDVGTGICVHDFSQTPCPRHLQCQADCEDYVWAKDDAGRLDEIKRVYVNTKLSKDAAVEQTKKENPKYSKDWIEHENKKLATLEAQLRSNGIEKLDVDKFLADLELPKND